MNFYKNLAFEYLNDVGNMKVGDFKLHYYNHYNDELTIMYKNMIFEIIDYDEETKYKNDFFEIVGFEEIKKIRFHYIYIHDLLYQLKKLKLENLFKHQIGFIKKCLEPYLLNARNLNLDEFIIIQKNTKIIEKLE